MRLLIKLKNTKEQAYELRYYHKLQGFIYNLIKDTEYGELHNREGYKFFSFSNIFPMTTRKGDERNLIIASPDEKFINVLLDRLSIRKENLLHIGEYEFELCEIKKLELKLENKCTLITGTPIVIRIPKEKYEKYGINEKYSSVYWKKNYSFEAFIKQLEDNLFKKYNAFYNIKINEFPIFEKIIFKKPTINHVIKKGKEYKVFGSLWEFNFSHLNNSKRKILEFGLDTGFGEMNSLGFGFMNVEK